MENLKHKSETTPEAMDNEQREKLASLELQLAIAAAAAASANIEQTEQSEQQQLSEKTLPYENVEKMPVDIDANSKAPSSIDDDTNADKLHNTANGERVHTAPPKVSLNTRINSRQSIFAFG